MKLNLGYCVSLPLIRQFHNPEYSIKDKRLVKNLSKKFNSIQIMFLKSKLNSEELIEIKKLIIPYKNIFVHATYKINIGAELLPSKNDLYNTSIENLLNELEYSQLINAKGIVLHMGKNVKNKFNSDHIYNNMIKFIIELFNKLTLKNKSFQILLETPAGQSGEMCSNLIDFVEFIQKFKNQKFYSSFGICIDTCHIFQAGYDINNDKIIDQLHQIFYPIKDKIKLIHLNDSNNSVGQHIDRHAQIGHGHIHTDKLIKFIYPYYKIPMILETIPPYDNQIKLLS